MINHPTVVPREGEAERQNGTTIKRALEYGYCPLCGKELDIIERRLTASRVDIMVECDNHGVLTHQ